MRRFFTEPQNISSNTARILEDASHIARVLRMESGERILLFDGSGWEYIAELTQIDAKVCLATILEQSYSVQEPKTEVTIFQGIPKSGKMESIIQKSVELGVSAIVPTALERCVSKLEQGKKETEKLKRWNKISLEAAKQCGRGKVPKVLPPITLDEAIKQMKSMDLALMPYELLGHQGECSLKQALQSKVFTSVGILIGPEGGFSDAEAEKAKEAGVTLVGLGKRILRTETVASAMLSMIMYEKNEM